ncbi:MAG: type II secretion system protein [Rhodoferax sp.]
MERPTVNGRQSGFTYIGLLIAVAIMGAMLAALGTVWHTQVQREHEKELLFIGNQFRVALHRYYQNNQRYPMRLEYLVQDEDKLVVRRYLRKIYIDPLTRQADWGTVKLPDGQIVGVYSLSEKVPLKQVGFRLRNMNFEKKNKYSDWLFTAEGYM